MYREDIELQAALNQNKDAMRSLHCQTIAYGKQKVIRMTTTNHSLSRRNELHACVKRVLPVSFSSAVLSVSFSSAVNEVWPSR